MNKKYIIFIAASIVILLWAYSTSRNVVSNPSENFKNGALLIPDLEKNIDNVGTVIIRSKGKSFKVHVENGKWVMPNKFSYPVGTEKIRDLVQNSARIKILEKKTSDPKNLAGLGLDDPEKADSNAVRIVLLSADEKTTYADYIRGINRKGVSASANHNDIYARLFDSNQSYLVNASINFDLSAHALLSGETFSIKYDKIQSIAFNYPNAAKNNFTIAKNIPGQLDFDITEPQGNKIKAFGKVNAISTSLEYMELQDIAKHESLIVKEPEVVITYKTFNGLTLIVNLFKDKEESWLTFAASADATNKQSTDDANRINALASPWVYKVDFKSTGGFYYKLDDLLKE